MSAEIAISLQNISKRYKRYSHPVERLKELLLPSRNYAQEFWALRNLSFEIKQGETVGIVGRNGAGKSTLLQIICGTLTPSSGDVQVNGRVAALLELGAGFNAEFTGRENVYMNGAIMGLSKRELDDRFDNIVGFADIGDFVDQPVKTYSSGMYIRLAFAAAIHIEPDILIVDEALAVGDMFFQAKCMARMKQMIDDGVTVLFVSHDTSSVKSLCSKALLLHHGELVDYGSSDEVVENYFSMKVKEEQTIQVKELEHQKDLTRQHILEACEDVDNADLWSHAIANNQAFQKRASFSRIQNGKASFVNILLLNNKGEEINTVDYEQIVTLRMFIEISEDLPILAFGYHIRDRNGVDIVYSDSCIEEKCLVEPKKGHRYIADWKFKVSLTQGLYNIACVLSVPIDLEIGQVDFCDFVPLSAQFAMTPRKGSRLYGSIHWENLLEIQRS
jgi:lipopolysaccharide transport system ATP-binding protein